MDAFHLVGVLLLVLAAATHRSEAICEMEELTFRTLPTSDWLRLEGTPSKSNKPNMMPAFALMGSDSWWKPLNSVQDPYLYFIFDYEGSIKAKSIEFTVTKAMKLSIELIPTDDEAESRVKTDNLIQETPNEAITLDSEIIHNFRGDVHTKQISLTFVRASSTSNVKIEHLKLKYLRCS